MPHLSVKGRAASHSCSRTGLEYTAMAGVSRSWGERELPAEAQVCKYQEPTNASCIHQRPSLSSFSLSSFSLFPSSLAPVTSPLLFRSLHERSNYQSSSTITTIHWTHYTSTYYKHMSSPHSLYSLLLSSTTHKGDLLFPGKYGRSLPTPNFGHVCTCNMII